MIPPPSPRKAIPLPARPTPKPLAIAKQDNLFGMEEAKRESEYTSKIVAPTYEPKNRKPDIFLLVDRTKAAQLLKEAANCSKITNEEYEFLVDASRRHLVFNYRLIADYYAHASAEMQRLMERSGLVIIDFDDAVKHGYVKYTEDIAKIYVEEHGKA